MSYLLPKNMPICHENAYFSMLLYKTVCGSKHFTGKIENLARRFTINKSTKMYTNCRLLALLLLPNAKKKSQKAWKLSASCLQKETYADNTAQQKRT
jgi:hypothetical protein